MDSEIALKQEISWASHLSLQVNLTSFLGLAWLGVSGTWYSNDKLD